MEKSVVELITALQAAQDAVRCAVAKPSTESWVSAEGAFRAILEPLAAAEPNLSRDLEPKVQALVANITEAIVLGARNVPGTATWDSHENQLVLLRHELLHRAAHEGRTLSHTEAELRETWLMAWREHRKLGLILNGLGPEQAAAMVALMSPDEQHLG